MERTQCQWWRSLPIAEWWYVHYILSKMVCTFHFVSALKYAVAFIELSCDSLYYQNVWLRHSMYLISQWDCFRGIVTHETWVQTWIPIQVSLATCTIGAYSIGSLEATLSPFLEVIFFLGFLLFSFNKFVFKTTFSRSKSWLWTWNTLQCASSSCPFALVGITPPHID